MSIGKIVSGSALVLLALFQTELAHAGYPSGSGVHRESVARPPVSCWINLEWEDAQGYTAGTSFSGAKVMEQGKELEISHEGFVLTAGLRRNGAADGGPLFNAYELNLSLRKEKTIASTSSAIDVRAVGLQRGHVSLTLDRVTATAFCDSMK